MNKNNKHRSREERIEIINLVKNEYQYDKKWNHEKKMEYYRQRTGIRANNDLYDKFFKGDMSAEEFLETVDYESNKGCRERQRAKDAWVEIIDLIKAIEILARSNNPYIQSSYLAEAETENGGRNLFGEYEPLVCRGQKITIKLIRTV